ncbi:MAG: RND family efflux transporter, MFP subunit [Solidesulfovibrio magneticus str. Maddingley MBC34]|uniref:RND family efflux transporter, MFP subunit n=1 Tax=Solidesulfovibrio magneticus str. Maddingley MBC34 TaxID=1206767 RepID=K6GUH1_9BACT|nr:MAG: RND family efflux transporter, MFP subunit [Solidesulfovibrio magneticus str. Maddingley MBC34]
MTLTHTFALASHVTRQYRALLLLASLLFGLAGCHEATPPPPYRPVVNTMRISLDTETAQRTYPGVVVARHEVQESFRVGGRIEKRLVDVGDHVREGQVLATLDEKDLRLSVESAQAELRAALSNKDQTASDDKRYATLLAKHVVSQSEYDLKHLAADEARSRVERADSALKLAVSQLGYAKLLASTDGVVTKTSAEAGQVVPQGQGVVTVARKGALEVLVDIPERHLKDIKESQAEISFWANRDVRCRAVLRETSPSADPGTRTYAVRYSLADADPAVRLGMTATLHLSEAAAAPTARIPASALLNQGSGPGVWRVDVQTGQLTFVPVTVDHYTESDAYVRSGQLAAGDVIVTAGVQKLDKGLTVRLADAATEAVR